MRNDTALAICPDYPPANLARLPHYDGEVSTSAENRAVFLNLWDRGEALINGDMEVLPDEMTLTYYGVERQVEAFVIQPASYPKCGFTLKLNPATEGSRQHLAVELFKIVPEGADANYIRQKFNLYEDGTAGSESLKQGMSGKRLIASDKYHVYEDTHPMTTSELKILDDLFGFIGDQNKLSLDKAERQQEQRKGRLSRYIGRRMRHCWYFLAG